MECEHPPALQGSEEFKLGEDEKFLGAICYPSMVTILVPFIIYLVKGNESSSLKFHAAQGIATHIAFIAGWFILMALYMVIGFLTFGIGMFLVFPFMLLFLLGYIGLSIYWGIKVFSDRELRIPYITDAVMKNIF